MNPSARKQVESILKEAAQMGEGESLEGLISKLTPDAKARIEKSAKGINKLQHNVTRRAKAGLGDISDAEWDRLVNEANADDD